MNEQPKYTSACLEAGQLVAWFDDALPAEEARAVQMHLETCAYCTRHVNELLEERQQAFNLLAQLDPPSMKSPTLTTAAFAHFQEHISQSSNDNVSLESMPFTRLRRGRPRFSRLAMQTLVAALIITVLVGTILSLLIPHVVSPGSSPELFPSLSTTPVVVSTEAGGLSMSMQLTAGPYFLNEMLQVDLSISNHSSTNYMLSGWPFPMCTHSQLQVVMQGGTAPSDTTLEHNLAIIQCPVMRSSPGKMFFVPGETLPPSRQYVVLTRSGHVQLMAQATFLEVVMGKNGSIKNGNFKEIPVNPPLSKHWPTIQLNVSPHIPAQRTFVLKQHNASVTVVVPPITHTQLLYTVREDCLRLSGGIAPGWNPLPVATLQIGDGRPGDSLSNPGLIPCNSFQGPLVRWTYAIGAPGLATQSGSYTPKT